MNYTLLCFDNYENFRRPGMLANGGASFDYRGLSLRWNVVWVPMRRTTAIGANGWADFEGERLHHDEQFGYRVSSCVTLFINARNIFNRPQNRYFGPARTDIMQRYANNGAVYTVGLRGQF